MAIFQEEYILLLFISKSLPDLYSLFIPPDLPPVYTYPPITMGYKAGPSPPEARLAEQPTMEEEPAEPGSKSLPQTCHIQPLTDREEVSKEESGRDCKVVESQSGVIEKESKETKGCSVSEPQSKISGLPPCPLPAPVPDPACPVTATGKSLKVELSLGCLGQKAGLEEPQLSKEQEDGKEDMGLDGGEKIESEPTECTDSVPVEPEEEEAEPKDGENVEVIEDEEGSAGEDSVELLCCSPAPSTSADPVLPPTASTAAQLQGAYMWSLELLIAAALCATRDALYPPVPVDQAQCPPSHHGMEILGELAELEIQQRSRESKDKDTKGKHKFKKHAIFTSMSFFLNCQNKMSVKNLETPLTFICIIFNATNMFFSVFLVKNQKKQLKSEIKIKH